MSDCTCFSKDPDARLNYGFDWSAYLGDQLIIESTWTLSGDTTVSMDGEAVDDTSQKTEVWLVGGTPGSRAYATNRITTDGGLIDDRTLEITIMQR